MYCKKITQDEWEKRQAFFEAEADYRLDKERIKNKEYRFLFRFIKRALRFVLVMAGNYKYLLMN